MIVDKVNYVEELQLDYEELFTGFDDLKAVTYSYDLNFISRVAKNFKTGHILLGSERLVKGDVIDVMAHQKASFDAIRGRKDLIARVEKNELKFSVLHDCVSHAKVFLLSSEDGRRRVITGSANMTFRGMSSQQIESVHVCDDTEYYNVWIDRFNKLCETSVSDYVKEAFVKEIPATEEEFPIMTSKEPIILLVGDKKSSEEKVELDVYTENLANIKAKFSSADEIEDNEIIRSIKPKKGIVSVTETLVQKLKAVYDSDNSKEAVINRQLPKFIVDSETGVASINGENVDLNCDIEDVKNDIDNLEIYMNGFSDFEGKVDVLKRNYYKLLNYMFSSPFLGQLRQNAYYYDFPLRCFPIYYIIYGASDAGKTSFVQAVQKLMFGRDFSKLTTKDFSTDTMAKLKAQTYGVPILIDDVETSNFNSAGMIVKHDDNLIKDSKGHSPIFVLTSNKVKNVKPDVSKRMFISCVNNRISRETANINVRKINAAKKAMGNNFYKYYLSKMIPAVNELLSTMSTTEQVDYVPDLYSISAKVISDIYEECGITLPGFLQNITVNDYTGDAAIAENAKELLRERIQFAYDTFEVDKGRNLLTVDFSNDESSGADRTIKCMVNELPPSLNCREVGKKLIFNLDETEKFLNRKFKKKFKLFK